MGEGQKITQVLMSIIFLSQVCWTEVFYYTSTYEELCYNNCSMTDNGYYWCNTDRGWDYCSPAPDVTYRNEPCRSDHSCDTHGYSYTWCWTDSCWDYCGRIETSDVYSTTGRQKSQPNKLVEICTHIDKGNKKVTTITAAPNPTAIADGSSWRNEITNLISRWNNGYLGNQARSQLITSDNLRIDLQGLVRRNNRHYYNLQIQINVHRQAGTSTTVAQVLIPQGEDVPDRYVRMAFTESFRRCARVFVDVSHGIIPVRRGQNCE